jgi:hypothetical protein
MSIENRLHPRAQVHVNAGIRQDNESTWEEALLIDISATGAGLQTAAPLPLRSEIQIRFQLPVEGPDGGREFFLSAIVIRETKSPPGGGKFPTILGTHFLGLKSPVYEWLRRWVWDRAES